MKRRVLGFTLLEVMVAVAILAVSLSAIFASEAAAIKTATRARKTNAATILARCKLAEIEEKVMREGFPAVEAHDEDECCEDAEIEGYECQWKLERVLLPEASEDMAEGLAGAAGGSSLGGESGGNSASMDSILASGGTGAMGGDMAAFAIQLVYPVLKPTIEEQVRRATVKVVWREGSQEKSIDVMQYLVSDGAAIQDPNAPTQ